jgi:nucleoside-diphosphate-sugar epimerase
MSIKALIIGGTGLISVGIVKHLLARGADITMYNRGQREGIGLPPEARGIKQLHGDRNDAAAFAAQFKSARFDVVIDMICFNAEQAELDVRAFGGRCKQFIFCSTVCTYGVKIPDDVLVDETFPQEPISGYGRNKMAAEAVFLQAHEQGRFAATIIRPSNTYGPGGAMIDQLEFNTPAWDRIERGLPVLIADGGVALWVSTHRDDVGKLFAYAALNEKTYGQAYNATHQRQFTWRQRYRETAEVLGKTALLLSAPADWIVKHDPKRFVLLKEITAYHGAYDSSKARRDVPEFRCEVDYRTGAKQTLDSIRQRGAWRNCADDALYQSMVDKVLAFGVEPVEA